jgi:flagellar motor component MotA
MPTRAHPASMACLIALFIGVVTLLGGCSDEWSQSTPEETIKTARRLVEKKRTREMYKLVYAESPEMTGFLQKLGVLFSNMQKLATQIETSMPDEVAKLKAKTQEAVESGKAADVLSQMSGQRGGRRRGQPDFRVQERLQEALDGMMTKLLTDPY